MISKVILTGPDMNSVKFSSNQETRGIPGLIFFQSGVTSLLPTGSLKIIEI